MDRKVLVTGGCGYIGTHTCIELVKAGYQPVVIDNLSKGSEAALERIQQIIGAEIPFFEGDVRNRQALLQVFNEHQIKAVLHFAGLKSPVESVNNPLSYYDNNVVGTCSLLDVMSEREVKKIVFSSTAAVYGEPEQLPVTESTNADRANHPYGRSKRQVEQILQDLSLSDPDWRFVVLRYFNPVGAHESGLIGEDPLGSPSNLVPFIAQVAVGRRKHLKVYGNDYKTPDGTGVRDYIHVVDLAKGHIAALNYLFSNEDSLVANLGTGKPYSVMEIVRVFERVSDTRIPIEFVGRRSGDVACSFASVSLANEKLHWRAESTLVKMCEDAWRWHEQNPYGLRPLPNGSTTE
jgi:UDP-glucose 4-epimerase